MDCQEAATEPWSVGGLPLSRLSDIFPGSLYSIPPHTGFVSFLTKGRAEPSWPWHHFPEALAMHTTAALRPFWSKAPGAGGGQAGSCVVMQYLAH